jgi:hypothetical protein
MAVEIDSPSPEPHDLEGYEFSGKDRPLERLMSDIRIMSPASIERAAQGWDIHVGEAGEPEFLAAERAAIHALEVTDRWPAWMEAQRTLFGLTESGNALISWKAEHGDVGHKAERAAYAAGLALAAGELISAEQRARLMRPMAEALPWLLG